MALLLANDHAFKGLWPGLVTGKLSDVAGLAFFPLVLLGCWEVACWVTGRWRGPGRVAVVVAAAATGAVFVAVKTTAAGADAFGWALAAGQWMLAAPGAIAGGHLAAMTGPAPVARDATDLIALPALLIPAYVAGRRRAART